MSVSSSPEWTSQRDELAPVVELQRRDLFRVEAPTEARPRYILESDMSFCKVTSEGLLKQALKLQADRYLEEGYITADDINEDGTIKEEKDPDRDRAEYFVLLRNNPEPEESKIVATVRLIHHDPEIGLSSFPVLRGMSGIHPVIRALFESTDLTDAVEVSGLAESRDAHPTAAFELYREIWKEAVYKEQKHWIFGADDRLYQTLTAVFGEGILAIGKGEKYMGSTSYPAMIDTVGIMGVVLGRMEELRRTADSSVAEGFGALMLAQKQLIEFFFHDFDTRFLSPEQREILEYTRKLEIQI